MRRGLISWSKLELPEVVLKNRVSNLQIELKKNNIDAFLAYTSISQPSAVNWLTHFTPYWSEALLVIFPDKDPVLLASLTKRVHSWIREVSLLSEIIMSPKIGEDAQRYLNSKLNNSSIVGVVNLDSLPASIAITLSNSESAFSLVDASSIFQTTRNHSDTSELGLVKKATNIADTVFSRLNLRYSNTNQLASELELNARLLGAEEVIIRVAPDLNSDHVFVRLESDILLGLSYGVELTIAYKGVWIRSIRNLGPVDMLDSWVKAKDWCDHFSKTFRSHSYTLPSNPDFCSIEDISFEACCGTLPLEEIKLPLDQNKVMNAWGVLSIRLKLEHSYWSTCYVI
jgi:hypothetical protein